MNIESHGCFFCLLIGRYLAWGLLLFGGIVGSMPYFGLATPSHFWEVASAYMMALALLLFALSAYVSWNIRNHDMDPPLAR